MGRTGPAAAQEEERNTVLPTVPGNRGGGSADRGGQVEVCSPA